MSTIDITKPVQLRNGWRAEAWKSADGSIWGRYYNEHHSQWVAATWNTDGRRSTQAESLFDLINVPEVKEFTVWGNVYADWARVATHTDKGVADACVKSNRAGDAAVPIHVRIEGDRVKIWGGT